MSRPALLPPAAPSLTSLYASLLAREGAAGVAARLAEVRATTAREAALRTAVTAPPGADDLAARRWARRPVAAGGVR